MSTCQNQDPSVPAPRLSGRIGQLIGLDTTFYHNGVATAPWGIRRIDIYKNAVQDANKVASIEFPDPRSIIYPSPTVTDPANAGFFQLNWAVPPDLGEGLYFDVWRFIGTNPGPVALGSNASEAMEGSDATAGDPDDPALNDESLWLSQCNRFWLFPDGWFLDDGLVIPRFAFEPLDSRFRKGEVRTLEVGITPLPLYDFEVNRIMPLIPRLCAYITIQTENCELLVDRQPCRIGLRQGTFRSNPYVVQATIDTTGFLVGTYVYQVKLDLPNGENRISEPFRFDVV